MRAYAALLTAQGKYLHDFIMVERGECALARRRGRAARRSETAAVDLSAARQGDARDERPELAVAAVFGEGAFAALSSSRRTRRGARRSTRGVALRRSAARGARRARASCRARDLARRSTQSASRKLASRHTTGCGSSLGVPDGSRDLVLEKSILLEAGFDELNGVDWQKGCYIGQELTARTQISRARSRSG